MKIIIGFFILMAHCIFGSSLAFAQPVYNPMQIDVKGTNVINEEPSLEWTLNLKNKFRYVRVKVFPHNSLYNAPLRRDVITNKLTISSLGVCHVFKSKSTTSEHGITRNQLWKSGTSFEFNTENLTQPVWIECAQPIEIKRPDYPASPVRYAGVLFIKKVEVTTPYITAVNVLHFEQYLKGVVPSEMPASWPAEALKAQAIAARTYAYYELGMNVASQDKNLLIEKSGAQIDDTVTYQAYHGLKNNTTATDQAVDVTSGLIMTYNNKIIKAYFHADSGGHTENAENVWGIFHPYIIGKPEIYSEDAVPGSKWSYVIKLKKLEEKLIAAGILVTGEELDSLNIDINNLYPSTRPKYVELKLTNGVIKKITAVEYSFATGIKSPWIQFTASTEPQSIVISGRGFGHGAGMNQWGARVMIEKFMKKYDEVLKFYYTDITITN